MGELFNLKNNWYKGNLHVHTNISDGKVSPEECIEMYKNAGYDFLAITDHRKIYEGGKEYQGEDFLLLRGAEFDFNDYTARKAWHVVGIDMDEGTKVEDIQYPKGIELTAQHIVDSVIKNNGFAILAHPFWSLLTFSDLIDLKGYLGIEIWNTVTGHYHNRGDSRIYIDVLAARGKYPLAFAADDTHFYKGDMFGGFIMVNSESLKREDIVRNIKSGNFYSSQGPQIEQIIIGNGKVYAKTSPSEFISFMTDSFSSKERVNRNDGIPITEATYTIKEIDSFVRVECKDMEGKRAWSQVIPLKK